MPSNVRELISLHEGRRPYAYTDSLGYWTIGVGHLVDKRKMAGLPEPIIDALLDHDIQEKIAELVKALPWSTALDPVRQAVLVDMAFNLGVAGLLGFPKFLAALKTGDYTGASLEMMTSRWATQVGSRAARLALMIQTGEWPAP